MLRTFAVSCVLAMSAIAGLRAEHPDAVSEKTGLLTACEDETYAFSPKVRAAFLVFAKSQALAELNARGQTLPADFLAWIDADPDVKASVYGTHHSASDVLLWLFSLRLDLGPERFAKYSELALAMAIVSAKLEEHADVTPRDPAQVIINGDPRTVVDTQSPGRALDMNDHIINFLNANTIAEDVVIGHTNALPELKYDERGIAIPVPKGKHVPAKVPVTERRTRTLYAADVIASTNLQQEFNAYMQSNGHAIDIDCGERILHWKSRDMVRGEQYKKINDAYLLFRGAYEAKGLLPAQRDPFPTPAERCLYLIRNNEYKFPPELQAERKWPRFPLTAPWPILTMLAANNQPLREREERWLAFRDKGEFKTYGEYIGSVAQQFPMQSARRLKPYPFTYGTIQMMLKDGGVCGTMAAISSRSHNILGIPASQASQPGHCAMVAYSYDPKSKTYSCKGGQYATGGDDKTTPFVPWFSEDSVKRIPRKSGHEVSFHQRRPMVYHQSVAWAVNYGMTSYLDSTMAHAVFRLLPEDKRGTDGVKLLVSGLVRNPYNFLLVDAAQSAAATPQAQIELWHAFRKALAAAAGKPGCPTEGLYDTTVKSRAFAAIARLPVPEDKRTARGVLDFLEEEACDVPEALVAYRLARDGLPAVLACTENDFAEHLRVVSNEASGQNDESCARMAATVKAVADRIEDRKLRTEWALTLWGTARGHEKYFGHKYRVNTHPALPLLARLSGRKLAQESELIKPVLERVASEFRRSVAGERDISACRQLAAKIQATGDGLKDEALKHAWFEELSKTIGGKETFMPSNAKKNAKPLRDPCADTIKLVLESTR